MGTSDSAGTQAAATLGTILDAAVAAAPDSPALRSAGSTSDGPTLSYRELSAAADRAATGLTAAGIAAGDAVALIYPDTAEFVIGLLGAARAGAVVAPLDMSLPADEITARATELGVRATLSAQPHANLPRFHITDAATGEISAPASLPPVAAHPDLASDDALVLFTSGTTGRPKLVPIDSAGLWASVQGIAAGYRLGPTDRTLAVMPFFHGHGLFAGLLATLASGGVVTLPKAGRFSAHSFWEEFAGAAPTWITAVPSIYEISLARPEAPERVDGVRFLRSCSAALANSTALELQRRFAAPVVVAYGMTETAHQTATELPDSASTPAHDGSVGYASSGNELSIGDGGEVLVRGATVSRGYLGSPAMTAEAWNDGWFRTGDLGRMEDDGRLFLTGRIKNIINRGGEKVSPERVEDVVLGLPGVVEAAAFPVPDAILGERVGVAVVADDDSVTEDAVIDHCRSDLARFEVPDVVRLTDALPHTAKGAVDRVALALRFSGTGDTRQ